MTADNLIPSPPPAPDTKRIHHILGTVAFLTFLALIVLDSLPNYVVSSYLAALLVVSFLILLGFGAIISQYLEARYG